MNTGACQCLSAFSFLILLMTSSAPASAQSTGFPPYPASNPDVILDVGITSLSPRNLWSALPTGFKLGQVSGLTPGTISDTAGFTPNTGGYIENAAAFSSIASSKGTVYMRVQRAALSIDDSTDSGINFFDSTGNTSGGNGPNEATAFTLYDGHNSIIQWGMTSQTNGADILVAGSWLHPGPQLSNSHGSTNLDPTYVDLAFTWQGTTYWAYFDGVPVGYGTFSAALPASGQFSQITIGAYLGGAGSVGRPLGPFAIQRFQLSMAFSPPPILQGAPVIGFYGDSFVVQGAGVSADASSPSVAQINAVQAQMHPTTSPNADFGNHGQDGFISRAQAYALKQFGGFLQLYTAAESGHGWAYTGMGGTTVNNTPAIDDFSVGKTAYSDALNAAAPAYIFAFGSVNDVNNGTPTNLVGDMEAHFNYWANNNPNLKGIYYIETLSWQLATADCTSHGGVAGWVAEMTRQRNLMRAAFSGGYVAGTRRIPVTYIESYESWVEGANSARFLIASNPDNHSQSSNSGSSPNGHPDAEGNIQMIDAYVWPYLASLISTSGHVSTLSAGQSTTISAGQHATLDVAPSSSGPFTYQWYVGMSGNTSSPIAGAIQASFSTPALKASTNYWVQVISASGTIQNSTTITIAVTGSSAGGSGNSTSGGATDGPIPLWALVALGAGLISMASRRLQRAA
jgi:hypothetical protein